MRFASCMRLAALAASIPMLQPACAQSKGPAFSVNAELEKGYRLLYEQQFQAARDIFEAWVNQNPEEPFGQVSIAATYLFEEFFLQHILTSEYFMDDKRFLGGITGTPNAARVKSFAEACGKARTISSHRLKGHPRDPEALYSLTLCAGMQSDADSMLLKKHLDALKHLKEANSNAEILLRDHPDAYDAYVAPGVAYYVIGSLSSSARFVLWFG